MYWNDLPSPIWQITTINIHLYGVYIHSEVLWIGRDFHVSLGRRLFYEANDCIEIWKDSRFKFHQRRIRKRGSKNLSKLIMIYSITKLSPFKFEGYVVVSRFAPTLVPGGWKRLIYISPLTGFAFMPWISWIASTQVNEIWFGWIRTTSPMSDDVEREVPYLRWRPMTWRWRSPLRAWYTYVKSLTAQRIPPGNFRRR